jgi:hypothetical protein
VLFTLRGGADGLLPPDVWCGGARRGRALRLPTRFRTSSVFC